MFGVYAASFGAGCGADSGADSGRHFEFGVGPVSLVLRDCNSGFGCSDVLVGGVAGCGELEAE